MFKCELCNKVCKSERGLAMHMFAHKGDEGVIDVEREIIPTSSDAALATFRANRDKKLLEAYKKNELLQIQLENKEMQDKIDGVKSQPTQPEQKSELDTFQKFVDMQKSMASDLSAREENLKNKIREEIADQVGGEDSSMESRLAFEALGLLKAKMAAGQLIPSPVSPGMSAGQIPTDQTTLPEIKKKPMATEEQIIQEKIRSGEMKFPEAKKLFRKKYPEIKMSDAQLKKEFDGIKNG